MHEIRVSVVSPEAADHGVAELWAAGEMIGHTILDDSDLMLRIEPRRDRTAVVVAHAASRRHSIEPSTYSSSTDAPSPPAAATHLRNPTHHANRATLRKIRHVSPTCLLALTDLRAGSDPRGTYRLHDSGPDHHHVGWHLHGDVGAGRR